ncbi:beta-glucosidase [Sarracenia purpurea var. burkii]
MGLFENPIADLKLANQLGSQAHRELAREAVRKSMVLMKNGKIANAPLLPLPKKAKKILVAGSHAHNLGFQCGETTILDAIKATVGPNTKIVYSENATSKVVKSKDFSYAIMVVGEQPYAETKGANTNLTIPEPGPQTIKKVCKNIKCVVILISGRPLVIEPYLSYIDALVAAWLPGTEGRGVTDILFYDYGFTGKLSRTWFKTADQLPMNLGDPNYDPLFPLGFGLTTKPVARS